MHSPLKVPPQFFNKDGVWTLLGLFCFRFSGVFGIIVLSHDSVWTKL